MILAIKPCTCTSSAIPTLDIELDLQSRGTLVRHDDAPSTWRHTQRRH